MTPTAKKAAAGTAAVTVMVLGFLLNANERRAKEHADLRAEVAYLRGRVEYHKGLPTLDEIKALTEKEPAKER